MQQSYEFTPPDYKGGSIVNLMSSLGKPVGFRSRYVPLKLLPSSQVASARTTLLIVLDGLGYEYLNQHGKHTFLYKHLKGSMTTVFPSTTAAAVTAFATGLAPREHGLTGWHMYLKELGTAALILPFIPRYRGPSFTRSGIAPEMIFDVPSFADKISAHPYLVVPDYLLRESGYTRVMYGRSRRLGYSTLTGFSRQILRAVGSKVGGKKYIHAYWPGFDGLYHKYGAKSGELSAHFAELDAFFFRLVRALRGTHTSVVVTADHGMVDASRDFIIETKKHPRFTECLILPLEGDSRIPYCYVRPDRVRQFESYVRTHFSHACTLVKGKDLVKKGYYGLFPSHPRLMERIGDYVLLCKKNYVFKDFILGEDEHFLKGNHGGFTQAEMTVPFIHVTL